MLDAVLVAALGYIVFRGACWLQRETEEMFASEWRMKVT